MIAFGIDVAVKSVVVLIAAGVALVLLRGASAATRHLVCLAGIVALILLPPLAAFAPRVVVPISVPVPAEPRVAEALRPDTRPATATLPIERPVSAAPSSPAAPAALPPARPFPWPLFLGIVWLIGAATQLGPIVVGAAQIHRLGRRGDAPVPDARLRDAVRAATQTLGVRRRSPVTLRLDSRVGVVPMTWGWMRPVILLPASAREWDPERLRVVLLHEMAHIARADWAIWMLASLVRAAYWWNPLAWLLAARLRAEAETACDDHVLSLGIAAPDYAAHLLAVAHLLRPLQKGSVNA